MDFYEAIEKRRHVRKFKAPATEEQLNRIIVAGTKAPSPDNDQTWEFVVVDDPALIEFGTQLLSNMKLIGPADVDVILTSDGPKLLEINPRFGGGYPCSHMAGADFCNKIIAMRHGQSLPPDIGSCPEGVCMLKQDEIVRPDWPLS